MRKFEVYAGSMISKEREVAKYTKVTITQTGGTAVDKIDDINSAAKGMFAKIGTDLEDISQGFSEIGRPIDKYYSHFTPKEGQEIPGYELWKIAKFQATSGNTFKIGFTEDLLRDFKICEHCLKTAAYCIHGSFNKDKKRSAAGPSSVAKSDNKRMALAKYM